MTTGFSLDPSYRRPADGPVLIAGSPLRLFRLGAAGVRVVEAIERGTDLPSGHERLTRRLVDAGAIHPTADAAPVDPSALTIVVPALGGRPEFAPQRCRTIVVDDGSPVPITVPVIRPGDPLLRVVRLDANQGPAAARNAGLREVTTPYVAFVDTDVDVDEDTLLALAGQLDASGDALAAPRVCAHAASDDASVFQRFEQAGSPLDLGPVAARVAPTTRVSYVPAASIVCRVDAIRAVGGFDEALRYGEDVDLVWRLVEHGMRCRYEPASTVRHRTRAGWAAWLTQRFRYGTSAAPLAIRHPGALAPVRTSGWSVAVWGTATLVHPVVGASLGIGTTLALVRKLRDVPAAESIRLAGLGNLYAGQLLASTMLRAWWPISLAAAVMSARARRAVIAAVVCTAVTDIRRHRNTLDPARAVALGIADDLAYGAGVWAGMWRERTVAPITPELSSWPGSGRRDEA